MDNLLRQIGNRILSRRKQLRMTQEELAEKAGITPQTVSSAELGKKALRPENIIHTSMFISSNALFISDLLSSKTAWSGENPFHAIAAVRPSSPHFFARKGEKRTGSNVLPSM